MSQNADKNAAENMNFAAMAFMFLFFAVAAYAFWHFWRGPFIVAVFSLKWLQLQAYDAVVGLKTGGLDYLDFVKRAITGRDDPSDMYWRDFADVLTRVGGVFRWLFLAVMMGLGGLLMLRSTKNKKAMAAMGLDDFIREQSRFWTTSSTAVSFHPEKNDPAFAVQLQPLEYMEARGIPTEYDGASLSANSRELAIACFEKDIGPAWHGVERAPTHVRALVAILVTHGSGIKRKDLDELKPTIGQQLRDKIAPIYAFEKDPTVRDPKIEALIAPVLADTALMKPFLELAENHAYTSTVIIRAYEWAKKEGVLGSGLILWCKGIDRPLWYCLNNVGRAGAYHIEGAGAQSHYFYERASGKPTLEGQVDNAVLGLEAYLVTLGENIG